MSRHVEVTLRLYRDTWTFDRKTFGNISGGNGVFLFEITLSVYVHWSITTVHMTFLFDASSA